jgi:hypothetical protein
MKWFNIIFSVTALAMLSVLAVNASAQGGADAPIRKVTVYPDRALVTRVAEVKLPAGEQSILIENLPEAVLDESFRVRASGVEGLILLGMGHKVDQHAESPRQRVAELERQIEQITKYQKQRVTDRLEAFGQQKSLLLAVTKNSGTIISDQVSKGTIAVSQWEQAYTFVGSKLTLVNDSIRSAQIKMDSIDNQLALLQSELTAIRGSGSRATKSVQVDLRLARTGPVVVALEYTVPGATWMPLYDARLQSDTGTVVLNYNAEVRQHTGEDWNDVELTLSTATPSQGTDPGGFKPWYLSVVDELSKSRPMQTVDALLGQVGGVQTNEQGQVLIRGGRDNEVSYIVEGVPVGDPLGGTGNSGANLSLVLGSIVGATDFVATFTTQRKESIPSGDKAIRTTVGQYTLPSSMQFISRPRNFEGVYRMASVTNQNDAPLMPGRVAIFVGGDFLGNAVISSLIVPGEEFKLPFGRDNAIKVDRKVIADKRTQTADKVKSEGIIKIVMTNRSRLGRTIDLEEPLPTSKDNRIKIVLGDILPRPLSQDESGKANWTFAMKPGDSVSVSIPYRIEYAAGLRINGQ